ncbi:gamma-interferon-responsive lysosomal thiol protein [Pyrus x bretschneideri]|uniref:gamma-interferon-responsive lysosomal thiol protein n=1 Tax=Pyrus x bretschneideri TaxID=225117 RepID=UPI00202DFB2E|nr:gamma-interferon-responsive lysosomal thiol protein [Pyrus x bretschneideri]
MATSTYLFFTLIIASSLCSFGVSMVEAQKITLSVYFETLCPHCATLIAKNLARISNNGLITILNLRLVPWGNASTATFCQRGPYACNLNSLEAYAIYVLHDVDYVSQRFSP